LLYKTDVLQWLVRIFPMFTGVEALVSCGMMESLLKVINWYGVGHDHITVCNSHYRFFIYTTFNEY